MILFKYDTKILNKVLKSREILSRENGAYFLLHKIKIFFGCELLSQV